MSSSPPLVAPPAPSPRTYHSAPRVVPSFPGSTLGGLDVWTGVFHLQAKIHFCLDLRVLPVHSASSSSSTGTVTTTSASNGPTEGDANYQTRLASILYEWTDKAT